MPVIRYVPPDPTDVVIQGSLLSAAPVVTEGWTPIAQGPSMEPAPLSVMMNGTAETPWPDPPVPDARLRSSLYVPQNNAMVATPCGALIEVMQAGRPTLGAPPMSTTRWVVAGVTRDNADVPLPSCRVVILQIGYLAVDGAPVVAEAISSAVDGSFSIPVPGNGYYGIIAYKPGDTPTVAGITLFPLTPSTIG